MAEAGFEEIFNGKDLSGWTAVPRVYGSSFPGGPSLKDELGYLFAPEYWDTLADRPAVWTVEDGAIVGRQDSLESGYGGYLQTDREYGDFELIVEARPDWPADTGIILRKQPYQWEGIQVLVDHRKSGNIGGFYGNGIGLWHAAAFGLEARVDDDGQLIGLAEEDPATTIEPLDGKAALLNYRVTAEEFLSIWKVGDWNEMRVRIVGERPQLTSWINGVKMAEIDLAALQAPNYDADAVANFLGPKGRIAFEVHDSAPMMIPAARSWGIGAACRWRNIRVKEL